MTPDMLSKARANADRLGLGNVDFRLGEIEHLPVADASVDVVLSNCVINLSPDKSAVFRDAFRVLRDGGRLAISDVVATAPLPAALATDVAALTGCVAGAATVDALELMMRAAGFEQIRITIQPRSREHIRDWMPGSGIEDYVVAANLEGRKPLGASCCAPSCCESESAA
jgi:SAM-dependent methyltransferase